jgi:hypothetical protein
MPLRLSLLKFFVFGMVKDALSGGSEKIAQLVLLQALDTDQHDGMIDVMIRQVERSWIIGEECGALVEIRANDKRPWLRRPVRRDARNQPVTELDRR